MGDAVYTDDGREVGIIVSNNVTEIVIDFSRHTPIRKLFRLDKLRLNLARNTLPMPIEDVRDRLQTNVLLLDPVN
jgi:hypothetical protein